MLIFIFLKWSKLLGLMIKMVGIYFLILLNLIILLGFLFGFYSN